MAFKDSDIRAHMADIAPQVMVSGLADIEANIESIMENVVRTAGITTGEAAVKLLGKSQSIVPYDTGELHDSGRVVEASGASRDEILFDVLFDAPHAMRVHETPLAYKQGKGPPGFKQWQYLAQPAEEMKDELFQMVAKEVEKVIAKPTLGGPRLVKKGGGGLVKAAPTVTAAPPKRIPPKRNFFGARKAHQAFQARRRSGKK